MMKISGIENTIGAISNGLRNGGQESSITLAGFAEHTEPKDEVLLSVRADMLLRQAESGKAVLRLITGNNRNESPRVFSLLDTITFRSEGEKVEVSEALANTAGFSESFEDFWAWTMETQRISAELSLQSDDPAIQEHGARLLASLDSGTFRMLKGNEVPGLNLRNETVVTDRSETHSLYYNQVALKEAGLAGSSVGWHKDFGTFVITW